MNGQPCGEASREAMAAEAIAPEDPRFDAMLVILQWKRFF